MRAAAFGALATLVVVAGCHDDDETPFAVRDGGPSAAAPEFVIEGFDELYPMFLLRKIQPGVKAALWKRYQGKWVRWTGRVISFTANGLTLKHVPQTVTFDVSLWVDPSFRPELKRLKLGDEVTYIGRLDSYDDVFRTFYLVHGDVIPPAVPDAGPSTTPPPPHRRHHR